jgi:DNA-binding GntR family transcriptional regulator
MKGFRPPADDFAHRSRTPAAAHAYSELRRRILYGELPGATLLNEVETAEALGMSRTPVREALRELLRDGLIEEGPRRQAVVTTTSPELNREVSLMRAALEGLTAREAAQSTPTEEFDQLHLITIRARRALLAEDVNAFLDTDDEFHLCIAHIARLPIVEDTIRRLRGYTRLRGLEQPWTLDQLHQAVEEHEAIIDALVKHDPDAAEEALTAHIRVAATA